MKVAVQCESALLQRSIEMFLGSNLSSLKQCDLVLRDKKIMDSYNSLFISSAEDADIRKPFSKSQLYLTLEKFYKKIEDVQEIQKEVEIIDTPTDKNFKLLEDRIDKLTLEYKQNILGLVKAFYE